MFIPQLTQEYIISGAELCHTAAGRAIDHALDHDMAIARDGRDAARRSQAQSPGRRDEPAAHDAVRGTGPRGRAGLAGLAPPLPQGRCLCCAKNDDDDERAGREAARAEETGVSLVRAARGHGGGGGDERADADGEGGGLVSGGEESGVEEEEDEVEV